MTDRNSFYLRHFRAFNLVWYYGGITKEKKIILVPQDDKNNKYLHDGDPSDLNIFFTKCILFSLKSGNIRREEIFDTQNFMGFQNKQNSLRGPFHSHFNEF